MIIGVFGDSFAQPSCSGSAAGWSDMLKTDYGLQIKNFARGTTSLFWSYQQLISNISDVDCIIFVVTVAGRLYIEDPEQFLISNVFTIDAVLNNKYTHKKILSDSDREIYKAARQYYLNLSNSVFDDFVHEKIIESIEAIAKNHGKKLILIPAFDENPKYPTLFEIPLTFITNQELFVNFGDHRYRLENTRFRMNHLSKENNKILAQKILEILNGKTKKIKLSDFVFRKYADPSTHWDI